MSRLITSLMLSRTERIVAEDIKSASPHGLARQATLIEEHMVCILAAVNQELETLDTSTRKGQKQLKFNYNLVQRMNKMRIDIRDALNKSLKELEE